MNVDVAGVPVLFVVGADGNGVRCFVRRAGGRTLEFYRRAEDGNLIDSATGGVELCRPSERGTDGRPVSGAGPDDERFLVRLAQLPSGDFARRRLLKGQQKHENRMDYWGIKLETPTGTIIYSGDLGSPLFTKAEEHKDSPTGRRAPTC